MRSISLILILKPLANLATMNPPPKNPKPKPLTYICRDHGHENPQQVLDPNRIECPDCGCRILFKKRPRKIVMHLAR